MLHLNKVHHIAIICSDYQRSLDFYTRILGLKVVAEHFRETRQSFKTDLALGDEEGATVDDRQNGGGVCGKGKKRSLPCG